MIVHDRRWRGYNDGESVVTRCTECGPAWQSIAFSETAARISGENHVMNVHGIKAGPAREARQKAELRATRR